MQLRRDALATLSEIVLAVERIAGSRAPNAVGTIGEAMIANPSRNVIPGEIAFTMDVRSAQPVYLLHSLGEMDGGTRDLEGKATLIFGADGIVNYHAGRDLTPLFHHELFHLAHEKPFGECKPVWCSLWEEGLATYVAASLNPGAGDGALLLDLPKPIRPAVDADRRGAVCAVKAVLNSTEGKDYAALFFGDSSLPGWPSRMGYYVGYLAMADLGRTHSLKQLADMPQKEAKTALEGALNRLASCG